MRAIRCFRSEIPRAVGERGAAPSIHCFQSLLPFDWLHLPQAGTKLRIEEGYPVGFPSFTSGRRWSHSVALSPQYEHLVLEGSTSNISRTCLISATVGRTKGTIAATKTFLILVVRPVIVKPPGIRKQARRSSSLQTMNAPWVNYKIPFTSADTLVLNPSAIFFMLSNVRFNSPRSIRP